MIKVICHCGGTHIKLMPDFASSGLWCNKCGSMLDEDATDLPKTLIQKIQDWNTLWVENVNIQNYIVKKGFNKLGLKLAIEINKYHPCLLMIVEEK